GAGRPRLRAAELSAGDRRRPDRDRHRRLARLRSADRLRRRWDDHDPPRAARRRLAAVADARVGHLRLVGSSRALPGAADPPLADLARGAFAVRQRWRVRANAVPSRDLDGRAAAAPAGRPGRRWYVARVTGP